MWLSIRHAAAVKAAEDNARAIMNSRPRGQRSAPTVWLIRRDEDEDAKKKEHYEWWCDTFGASEIEFEEMQAALAASYKRTPPWRVKRRKEIRDAYIRVYGL